LREREIWVVGGFIFFWTFSPSFGPAMLYYQTDVLHFSQQFIGHLAALAAVAGVAGAFIYAPLSRRVPLTRLINFSIGAGVIGTLAYLVYRGPVSALVIDVVFGCVGMLTQLAFLDLAAKSCPRRVEATFFALLMSVYNGGTQISQNIGGQLYDSFGFTPLVLISAAFTGVAWLLVPLVKIDRIEDKAKQAEVPASSPSSRTPQSSRRS
jgi:predicted MFS family arabinose efflux permease